MDGDQFGFDHAAIAGMEHPYRRPPMTAAFDFMLCPGVLPRACPAVVGAAVPQRSEGTVAARLFGPLARPAGRPEDVRKVLTAR